MIIKIIPMKKINLKHFILIVLLLVPVSSFAQMFTVNNEGRERTNPFSPYYRVGVNFIDFKFTGNPNTLPFGSSLAFSGPVAKFKFESGSFNLSFSLGDDFTGLDDRNYFDLNINFINSFYLIRNPRSGFSLGIPVQLSSQLTNVRSDALSNEFSQTNLSAGAGAVLNYRIPQKFGVSTHFIPSVGFSTANGGYIGGSVFSMRGKARINFYNLLFKKNISLGYDFIYDSYDIDTDEYDYDLTGHAITLGIGF